MARTGFGRLGVMKVTAVLLLLASSSAAVEGEHSHLREGKRDVSSVAYFVSADDGDDSASGAHQNAPWKTLPHAQAMAREAIHQGKHVTVNLQGTFRLNQTLAFDSRDSGSVWKAAGPGTPAQASTAQTPTVGLKYGRSECSKFNCTVLYSLLKPRLRQFRSRRLCNHLPVFLDQHASAHQPLRDLVGVSEVAHSGRVSVHQRAIATESRVVLCENLACPGRAADRTTGDDAPFVRDAPGEQHVVAGSVVRGG